MVNAGKTVLLVQASLFQSQIWKLALGSQGLELFAASPDVDLSRSVAEMAAAGQALPTLILLDVGIKGAFNPYEFYRWCHDRYPAIKIILTNAAQIDIPAFEYQWARLQDPQDILPGFQTNNLIASAMANVNFVLAVIEGAPLQEEPLTKTLLLIVQRLSEQKGATSSLKPEVASNRVSNLNPASNPKAVHGILNPVKFMVMASAILLIAPLGYLAWQLYTSLHHKSVAPVAANNLEQSLEIATLNQHKGPVFSLIMSPDQQTLISASGDNTIKVWDLSTRQVLRTLSGHKGPVVSISISTDGKTLASGGRDRAVKLWDLSTEKLLRSLSGGTEWVQAVALSSDGKNLVSGNEDKTISVWDVATGSLRYLLTGHMGGLEDIAITPDGQTLASGSGDKMIKVWSLKTGMLLNTLQGHLDKVEKLTMSPDGLSVVSGDKFEIREWNVQTGKLLRIFPKFSGGVRCLAISPDRKWLASGHTDNTVRLWNFKTAELIQTFEGHADWVLAVTFDETRKQLISGSRDKSIKIWSLPLKPSPLNP